MQKVSEFMPETLYMKVTKDSLELPLAIADTVNGLANICGVDRSTVFRGLKKQGSGYVKVEVLPDITLQKVRDEIAAKGVDFFKQAKTEFKFHGNTPEYQRLINLAEGLRMALSIVYKAEQEVQSGKD